MDEPLEHDDLVAELIDLAGQLGVEVRRLPMGGEGGGLAVLRGKQILFVDTDAPSEIRLEKTAAGLSRLAGRLEGVFVRPVLRAMLERGNSG
jgi:hypothetical protein